MGSSYRRLSVRGYSARRLPLPRRLQRASQPHRWFALPDHRVGRRQPYWAAGIVAVLVLVAILLVRWVIRGA